MNSVVKMRMVTIGIIKEVKTNITIEAKQNYQRSGNENYEFNRVSPDGPQGNKYNQPKN